MKDVSQKLLPPLPFTSLGQNLVTWPLLAAREAGN